MEGFEGSGVDRRRVGAAADYHRENHTESDADGACPCRPLHRPGFGEEVIGQLAPLPDPGRQYDDHSKDQQAVADENDRLAGVPGNQKDRHFPAALDAIARLKKLEAAPVEFVVHPDRVGSFFSGFWVDRRYPAGERRRPAGSRVEPDLEIVQPEGESQIDFFARPVPRLVDQGRRRLALPQGQLSLVLEKLGRQGAREDDDHRGVGDDESRSAPVPGPAIDQGGDQVEGEQSQDREKPGGGIDLGGGRLPALRTLDDRPGRKNDQEDQEQGDRDFHRTESGNQSTHGEVPPGNRDSKDGTSRTSRAVILTHSGKDGRVPDAILQ